MSEALRQAPSAPLTDDPPWQRLHRRVIWVDGVRALLSLVPLGFAVGVFGVRPDGGMLWAVVAAAVGSVLAAVTDAIRWAITRYRMTGEHVEVRTGILVRKHRVIRRDRIRSVDVHAKLRHRLAGLRVVTIGAGQQSTEGEALTLDAVLTRDAEALRHLLSRRTPQRPPVQAADQIADRAGRAKPAERADHDDPAERADQPDPAERAGADASDVRHQPEPVRVFARLQPGWVAYNVLNVWAYVSALGLLWGGYWLLSLFGLDVAGYVGGLLDWSAIGWGWRIAIGLVVVGAIGVVCLGVNFFVENWGFELARVPGTDGTVLRTRKGLFTTREVNRDDNRMRGIQIAEPLLWRWMGAADTTVVTTGLSVYSISQPTAILPRGPVRVARPVAAAVLGADPDPLATALTGHPRAALRRRLWWGTWTAVVVTGLLTWLNIAAGLPTGWVWAGVALWPVALGAAVIAYRALGHAVVDGYLVVRSGLVSRATTVLQRSAVSTIAIRESPLQRRLGLRSVSAMTAAGHGGYEIADVDADEAIRLAVEAAPGVLEPFLVDDSGREPVSAPRRPAATSGAVPGDPR
ncbi:PH domain-containing protein [Plantactinospora sp. GCM10030261]|uniref:PH domain-containing protein n=1 Tax=Plantactinospora sp. GCM10030261 TaxID=3273420 RepID=UPI003616F7FE